MAIVSIQNLHKNFGKIKAVHDLSLIINEGEIFGLIGPNGAGKTTTLRVVATLLQPTAGAVTVFGRDLATGAEAIRKRISYLPEEAGAYKNMSGTAYLKFMARFYSGSAGELAAMTDSARSIAGLKDRIKDRISTYSKGMVRKLLIARALMHKPGLAILDEPTSGLDVMNSLEVRNIIKEYVRSGMTVLLSSHNMLEVEFLSTRVSLINDGRILESGAPAELKKKYQALNLEEVFMKAVA